MRVLVIGASGAIGTRLVTRLIDAGHEVTGTSTSSAGAARVGTLGASAVLLDLLDSEAARRVVGDAHPDAVVHQATALAEVAFARNLDRTFARTNRLRTLGADSLLAAAHDAGVDRIVAQSFAGNRYARVGGPIKTEDDPLDPTPPASMRATAAAMTHLDDAVTAVGGIALRYGGFYGAANDALVAPIRKRQFPIIGDGAGVTSFVHLDDAAAATVAAVERGQPGTVYNVVDDEPAAVRDWLPVLAEVLGAGPPRRVPRWMARIVAGDAAVVMGTDARGASNAKAKSELGWTLRHRSWRTGFVAAYQLDDPAEPTPTDSRRTRHAAQR